MWLTTGCLVRRLSSRFRNRRRHFLLGVQNFWKGRHQISIQIRSERNCSVKYSTSLFSYWLQITHVHVRYKEKISYSPEDIILKSNATSFFQTEIFKVQVEQTLFSGCIFFFRYVETTSIMCQVPLRSRHSNLEASAPSSEDPTSNKRWMTTSDWPVYDTWDVSTIKRSYQESLKFVSWNLLQAIISISTDETMTNRCPTTWRNYETSLINSFQITWNQIIFQTTSKQSDVSRILTHKENASQQTDII